MRLNSMINVLGGDLAEGFNGASVLDRSLPVTANQVEPSINAYTLITSDGDLYITSDFENLITS